MATHSFLIETGKFGLSKVDTADTGYLNEWQGPNGVAVATAAIADYTSATPGGDFSCQITSGALTASPNTTTDSTPATFCSAEETTTKVGVTSFSLDVTFMQDPDLMNGLNRYLFEWDTYEAYFYFALADDSPQAIGRCRIIAGTIGGDARTKLTATLSLPCSRKPDILFGSGVSTVPIETYA
jgi:hypothetical protein